MHPSTPDIRTLRANLMERLSAVKAYFEATSVSVGLKSPYWSAFDALRRNQPLAESFVSDLQQLLTFLEFDMVPALSQPPAQPSSVPPAQPAPPTSNWRSAVPPASNFNDEQTRLLTDMKFDVRRDLPGSRPAPAPAVAPPPARLAPPIIAPEMSDIETSPVELFSDDSLSQPSPGLPERRGGAPAPRVATPVVGSERRVATPGVVDRHTDSRTPDEPAAVGGRGRAPAAPATGNDAGMSARAAALMAVVTPDSGTRPEGAAPGGPRPSQLHKIISLPAVPQTSSIVTSVSAPAGGPRPSQLHKVITGPAPAPSAPAASATPAKPTAPADAPAMGRPSQLNAIISATAAPSASAPAASVGGRPSQLNPIIQVPGAPVSSAAVPNRPSQLNKAVAPAAGSGAGSAKPAATPAAPVTAAPAVSPSKPAASAPTPVSPSAAAPAPAKVTAVPSPAPAAAAAAKPAQSSVASATKAPAAAATSKPAAKAAPAPAAASPASSPVDNKPAAAKSAAGPAPKAAESKPAGAQAKPAPAGGAKTASAAPAAKPGPATGRGGAKGRSVKAVLQFDESDVSNPNESPSQFFRLLDSKLDDNE